MKSKRIILSFLIGLLLTPAAFASSTRITEADALISSDHTKTYTLPTTAGLLDTASATATFSNKTISGASNTLSNLPVASQMQQEVPSGTVNGTTTAFTLAFTPVTSLSVSVYIDGILQIPTTDYSISTATITFTTAPALGQSLRAVYSKF